jgi:hypothetical protein
MAVYHFNAKIVKRSEGHSAVAGAAYISASKMYEERTGIMHDYSRKRGVVHTEIIAPETTNSWMYDRTELWNRVELGEKRKDAQLARSIKLALPHELTDEQRADLVLDYARDMFVSQGMVADISIHRPDRHGDDRNHHAHILLTMREIDGDGFSRKKQTDWNKTELLEYWREEWANYQNQALENAGSDARVDHRTLDAQGSYYKPTIHMGKDATAMERKGIATDRGDQNREILAHNKRIDQLLAEYAALDAQIAAELEAEFSEPDTKGAGKEESRETEAEFVPEPEEETPEPSASGKQDRPRPSTQDVFNSPVAKAYEKMIFKEYSPAPSSAEKPHPEKERNNQPAAQGARTTQDVFNDPVAKAFESQIEKYGSIQERGIGGNWYDRTIVAFENLYYDAVQQVKSSFQKYFRVNQPQIEHDQEHDLDR